MISKLESTHGNKSEPKKKKKERGGEEETVNKIGEMETIKRETKGK